MTDQWLSIVEYAKKHDISDMTVRRRIRAGKVDAELREGKYFIRVPGGAGEALTPEPPRRTLNSPTGSGIRHGERHLDQLLERDTGAQRAGQPPAATPAGRQPELSYRPSSEKGYQRPTPPAIPVSAAAPHGASPSAPPAPPSGPKAARPPADRRQGDRRSRANDRRSGGTDQEFSYPELDLAGTPSPAVLPSSHSVEVQLSQLAAKVDHLAQPWQQELVASLKAEVALKDEKIGQLNQKIADLELIIEMLNDSKSR